MVVTYHHGTMRVAKDDLRTHVDEFIHEEETALEHLLMEEDATASLGSHYQQDGEKVWSQAWPRSIRESHDGAVDEGNYSIFRGFCQIGVNFFNDFFRNLKIVLDFLRY